MAECLTRIDFWYDLKDWGVFDCVKLMVDTHGGLNPRLGALHSFSFSLSPWKILGMRLAFDRELMRYDTTLAPLDRRSFSQSLIAFWVSVCMWLCARLPSLSSSMLPKPYWLVFIFTQSPPFLLSPNLILLSVFSEGGPCLTFVLLCNEQMHAVNVFSPCVCGIPAKHRARGGTLHLIIL